MEGAYQTLPRRGFGLFIALRLQNADVGEIAVVICVIEAVADDEFVRDLEAAHIGLVALGMARRLVQERDRRNGCGVPCAEELTQVLHGEARIDDVLDDDDMAARNVVVQILDEADDASGLRGCAVAGDSDEIHVNGAVHAAAQIDVEKRCALEHAHQHGALVSKLCSQIRAELLDAGGDGFFGKKDAFNVLFRRSDEHKILQNSRKTGVVNFSIINRGIQ